MSEQNDENNTANKFKIEQLKKFRDAKKSNRQKGTVKYKVKGSWKGNMQVEIRTDGLTIDDQHAKNKHKFLIDEPEELLGDNTAPTAQDYLLGGLAGSMLTTFIVEASVRKIKIYSLSLDIQGDLDTRASHGIRTPSSGGFDKLTYKFSVGSDAPIERLYEVANHVIVYCPNYATISRDSVKLDRTLTKI